jgi:hypothetical protein
MVPPTLPAQAPLAAAASGPMTALNKPMWGAGKPAPAGFRAQAPVPQAIAEKGVTGGGTNFVRYAAPGAPAPAAPAPAAATAPVATAPVATVRPATAAAPAAANKPAPVASPSPGFSGGISGYFNRSLSEPQNYGRDPRLMEYAARRQARPKV